MTIDQNTLDKIAQLSKLKLIEEDKPKYLEAFNKILGSMDKLSSIETTQVQVSETHQYPTTQREDRAEKVQEVEQITENAPKMNHGYFLVPKVIES